MTDERDQDAELMLRFQNGDDACFEALVERQKQRVLNIAYRFLGNGQDAEDVAQQVFVNVYNARKSYTPKAKFTTWLYAVCKNTCMKSLRGKRLKLQSLDYEADSGEAAGSRQLADPKVSTPLDTMVQAERDRAVRSAIESLPENQKWVLILCKYEQLSYEEITEITGFSMQTVKSLLHRARLKLKDKLAAYIK